MLYARGIKILINLTYPEKSKNNCSYYTILYVLIYLQICDRIRSKGWKVFRDPGGRMGPYATFEDQWVSFDDDVMVRHKAEYVRAMGLGGSMVWSMDLDDFTGRSCGCSKAPLLANINHVLREKTAPPACSLKESKSK
jgi:chitinase